MLKKWIHLIFHWDKTISIHEDVPACLLISPPSAHVHLHPCCVCACFPSCLIAMLLAQYGESGALDFIFQFICHQVLTRDNSEDESKKCNYHMEKMEACSTVSNRWSVKISYLILHLFIYCVSAANSNCRGANAP